MSSTLLKSLRIYKADEPAVQGTLYTVIVNTAESNVKPLYYHHWPIATGQKYEVMEVIARMVSDTFNGNLHWRGDWGSIKHSVDFLHYAADALEHAKEITGAVPDIEEYMVVNYKADAPGAENLSNFAALERFSIRECWNEKMLMIEKPTVSELYWGKQICEHYQTSIRWATEPGTLNMEKLQQYLANCSMMIPEKYRKPFQKEGMQNA